MPHRDAEYVERCSQCDREASTSCQRCGRPLCQAHTHDTQRRCERCEHEFKTAKRKTKITLFRTKTSQLFAVGLLATPVLAILGASQTVIIASFVSFFALFASLWREQSLTRQHVLDAERRTFLNESPRRQLAGGPD